MQQKKILVIGAGIIGLSTAYYLQSANQQVTLMDYKDPGSGTSRGHASMIANYGIPGINQPQVWSQLPRYLFSQNSPIAIKWSKIFNLTPWFIQFLKNCNTKLMYKTAMLTFELLQNSLSNYKELLADIDASELLKNHGVLYVWIDSKQQPSKSQVSIRSQCEVKQIKLSGTEVREIEPNLSKKIQGGWHFPRAHHTIDPDIILKKIFQAFLEKGGVFLKDKINSINPHDEKVIINKNQYDETVICTGSYSKELVKQIEGQLIPLETERGYHIEFPQSLELLKTPTCLVETGMYLSPLNKRIRAAGTVEFGGLSNKISQSRINYIVKNARRLLPSLQDYQNPWLGFRPTLPDCLPVIGHSPKYKNIYYAFGHNHLGWTLGPTTGRLIANKIIKNKPINELFSISRYLK